MARFLVKFDLKICVYIYNSYLCSHHYVCVCVYIYIVAIIIVGARFLNMHIYIYIYNLLMRVLALKHSSCKNQTLEDKTMQLFIGKSHL